MAKQLQGWVSKNAVISECGTYRYMLKRKWGPGKPVLFIMLNPSTADAFQDDPTIRRCMRFAASWGYGGILAGNLFAFRATNPKELQTASDPVGPENDDWLERLADEAGIVVAAWGSHGSYAGRDKQVTAMFQDLHCLALTSGGQPRHPLYLKSDCVPVRYLPL